MPGSLDDGRPTVISSVLSNPPSLIHRIGPKVEERDDAFVNGVARASAQAYDHMQTRRRASAPLQTRPTILDNDDIILPEHSISQAYQRVGGASLADRIATGRGHFVVDSEEALENVLRASASLRDPYGMGKGLPNYASTSRRAVSEMSSFSTHERPYENDAADSVVSAGSSTHSVSLKDFLIGVNAHSVANVVEVMTRFLPSLQRKVEMKGMFMATVFGIGANAVGSAAMHSSSEPPSVWVVFGHDQDAVHRLAQLQAMNGGVSERPRARANTTEAAAPTPEAAHQAATTAGDTQRISPTVGRVYVSSCQLLTASLIGGFAMYSLIFHLP